MYASETPHVVLQIAVKSDDIIGNMLQLNDSLLRTDRGRLSEIPKEARITTLFTFKR